jgi:hypothetical protein
MTYDPSGDLLVIDLRSGDVCHWLRVEGMVRELYDVVVLPAMPDGFGLQDRRDPADDRRG